MRQEKLETFESFDLFRISNSLTQRSEGTLTIQDIAKLMRINREALAKCYKSSTADESDTPLTTDICRCRIRIKSKKNHIGLLRIIIFNAAWILSACAYNVKRLNV